MYTSVEKWGMNNFSTFGLSLNLFKSRRHITLILLMQHWKKKFNKSTTNGFFSSRPKTRNNVTDYTSNLRKYRVELYYNSKWTTDENNRLQTLLKKFQKAPENLICLFSKTMQYVWWFGASDTSAVQLISFKSTETFLAD